MLPERECKVCKIKFTPRNHTQVYCGFLKYKTGCGYKEQLKKNKERSKERKYIYKKISRDYYLQVTYGVTEQWYLDTLEKQSYCCYICEKPRNDKTQKYLCVDHCHTTGKVRGLLCTACNQALGNFKDNIKFLKKAIEYLETNS